MSEYLTNEKTAELFKAHGGSEKNSGSAESQIALFTYRIKELSDHLKGNQKDHQCRRRLLTLVGKRRRLLQYLMKIDIERYRAIIEKLGIRK